MKKTCSEYLCLFGIFTDERPTDNAEMCSRIVSAEIRALKDKGIISTLKHYLGSAYNASLDSHLSPVNNETPLIIGKRPILGPLIVQIGQR